MLMEYGSLSVFTFGTYFVYTNTETMFTFLIKLIDSIVWPLVIVVAVWLVFMFNLTIDFELNTLGMRPREWSGIVGIFTMPFLHGDFDHLFSNSVPLLLSLGFIFIYFEKKSAGILILNALLTGILLLFIGEQGTLHIGASGLVYAYIFFLVTHAFFTKNKEMLSAAFILIFLYGSLIYGLFPEYGRLIGKNISWEGHLAGALSGIFWGMIYRKSGPQRRTFFENEDDDEDDDPNAYWELPEQREEAIRKLNINYHYTPKDDKDSEDHIV